VEATFVLVGEIIRGVGKAGESLSGYPNPVVGCFQENIDWNSQRGLSGLRRREIVIEGELGKLPL
jgi:hypothetical protein